jgi:hypothetical protein
MSVRRRVREAFVAVAVVVFGVEGLHWARHGAEDVLRATYPSGAVDRDLEPIFVRDRSVGRGEHRFVERTSWSLDRREISRSRLEVADVVGSTGLDRIGFGDSYGSIRRGPARTWNTPTFFGEPFLRSSPTAWVLRALRECRPTWSWAWEGGAFVARSRTSGSVVAAIGPVGVRATIEALGEDRFGELTFQAQWTSHQSWRSFRVALVDDAHERLVTLAMDRTTDDLSLPPPVSVTLQPIVSEIPPPSPDASDARWRDELRPLESPGRVRWIDREGRMRADVRLDAGEQVLGASVLPLPGEATASPLESAQRRVALWIHTLRPSDDRFAKTIRARIQRLGRPERRLDYDWRPTGAWQQTLEALACVPLALRPAPSAIASFLSTLPQDAREADVWWWRDPAVAGGHRPLALAANLLVALACGWFALRLGRRHCATSAGARACAALGSIAGPLGLLWLRLTVVRAATDAVAGARRSLALDVSPSSPTPWPAPAPTGAELLDPVATPAP